MTSRDTQMSIQPSAQPQWWQRLRRDRKRPAVIAHPAEADAAPAASRAVGGRHDDLAGCGSTTGTGRTGKFVGRISGDDLSYAGETGADRRSQGGHPRADKRFTGAAVEGSAARGRHRLEEPDSFGDGMPDAAHRSDGGPVLGVPG